jgi:hypothetical protein
MLARAFRRRTQVNIAIALLAAVWMDASSKSSLADKNLLRTKDSTATSPPQDPPKDLEEKVRALTQEFGVFSENIPDDFIEKVRRWARLYQTRDRDEMERVLRTLRKDFEAVQQQLANANLPPELVDERLDPLKSTQAACRYISRLRRDLGPDSSFLLAIAAYNMGPGRLKQRMQPVKDPLNRRDFWYLYRVRVLPAITRTHIARLMAAILIGRHPQHFGFKSPTSNHLSTISALPLSASTSALR